MSLREVAHVARNPQREHEAPNPTSCFSNRSRMPEEREDADEHSPAVQRVIAQQGESLDQQIRPEMGSRFGYNFANVRVHHDSAAAESARAVHARAYTVGQHIVFGRGKFAPTTSAGRELLAHELAHTVQQRSRAPSLSPANTAVEQAATSAGRDIAQGNRVRRELPASRIGLARAPVVEEEEDEKKSPSAGNPGGGLSDADLERLAEADPISVSDSPPSIPQTDNATKAEPGAQGQFQAVPAVTAATPDVAAIARQEAPVDRKLTLALEEVSRKHVQRRADIKKDREERHEYLRAHKEWKEIEIPVDDALRKVEPLHLPYELDVRFFQQVLSISRAEADALRHYIDWKDLPYDPRATQRKLQTQKTITYRTSSLRLVQEMYEEMLEDRRLRLHEIDELLNTGPDMALEMFKDVGRGYWNGALGFAQGFIDTPASPINLVQTIRGDEPVHLLDLSGLRADYQTNYGYHYGHSIETGTQLGLSIVAGNIAGGGGPATGASATSSSITARALQILSVANKVNTISTGATTAVRAVQAVEDLSRGYVIVNGEKRPLTEDDIVDRLVAIGYAPVAVKAAVNTAKSFSGGGTELKENGGGGAAGGGNASGGGGGAADGGGGNAGRRTLQSSPPPMPSNPTQAGPRPVTDVELVRANVSAPSSIKPQDPVSHQADWQARGGGSRPAPTAYLDSDGNIRVSTDHPLLQPATSAGVPVSPGERRGPHAFTQKRFGGAVPPVPAASKRVIGLADTGQAPPPAQSPAKPPVSSSPAPAPAANQPENVGLADTGQAPPQPAPAQSQGGSVATSGPRERVNMVQPVSLDRVAKIANLNPNQIAFSASSEAHGQGWRFNGGDPDNVPVAFIVDKTIYVDRARWPTDRPLPK